MIQLYKKEITAVAIISIFKLLILFMLPLTGDEAYFIIWGDHPMAGYYDHPPMVGWLIYLMRFFSESHIFYRMFSFVTTFIIGYVIYAIAKIHVKKEIAFLVALTFLASPIDLFLVMFTNDIPLLLFGSLGTLFVLLSVHKKEWLRYSVLAGIFLGLCFLSKYFAAFLMLGLLLFLLLNYRAKAFKNIAVIAVVSLLFVAQNLYFNYNSCWNNILFNFFSRTTQSHYHLSGVINYILILLYLLTPWGVYYLFKERGSFQRSPLLTLLSSVLLLSLGIFLLVALKNKVGLHWFLLFVPYLFLLFSFLSKEKLQHLITYNARFTYVHIALALLILFMPLSLFKEHKKYSHITLFTQTEAICQALDENHIGRLFTYGYTTASILSYHCKRDVKVLYNTNKFGRLDDKLLDVRTLNGKDFDFIDKRAFNQRDRALFKSTCKSISISDLHVNDSTYYRFSCHDFNYEAYKKAILDTQKELYYTIPSWLPTGKCYFLDRYYP
jgi:4-amino-4-deoxy-L-arabinose transferase-like glycosyltransferase